jgi:hypothetical protein
MRWGVQVALCNALAVAAILQWLRATEPQCAGIDFVQFRLTGLHVARYPGGDVYSSETRSEILSSAWQTAESVPESRLSAAVSFRHSRSWETYSSPFLYSLFALGGLEESGERKVESRVVADRYETELRAWHAVSLLGSIVGLLCCGWVLRSPWFACLLFALVLVGFSPIRSDLVVANVNQIQLGMVGVFVGIVGLRYRCSERQATLVVRRPVNHRGEPDGGRKFAWWEFIEGVWLGLCIAFKPSLIWVAVMWAGFLVTQGRSHDMTYGRAGRFRPFVFYAFGGMIGATAAVLFSLLWFPPDAWIQWIEAVRALPDDIIQTSQGNFSPTYYARHSLGLPSFLLLLTGPVLAAAVAAVLSRTARSRAMSNDELPASMDVADWLPWIIAGLQIHLLTSHLVWFHYLVLSLPALLWCVWLGARTNSRVERFLFFGVAAWCFVLLGFEPLDALMASQREEHFVRCFLANALLMVIVVAPPARHCKTTVLSR